MATYIIDGAVVTDDTSGDSYIIPNVGVYTNEPAVVSGGAQQLVGNLHRNQYKHILVR